ncbi:MAG TPA: phosphatidate cytidylyltransferase [Gemmatimonadales bacterium]|nr:phosphatidate cytidylyltransferase [Gemmatimonadales bacterium]
MSRNLAVRIAFAVPAIALTLVALWRAGFVLAALLAILGVLGAREVYDFARRQGVTPLAEFGYLAAALIPFAAVWAIAGDSGEEASRTLAVALGGAVWFIAVLIGAVASRTPSDRPLTAIAVTIFGSLYASALLACIVPIRHGAHSDAHPLASTALGLLPLAVTWICDTCAMAGGTLIGGPKLAPMLSPRKTVAGAVAGTIGAVVAALAYGPFILDRVALHLAPLQLGVIGLAVAGAAQIGDVAESLLKREVGLKDSSHLIPGHGGVLDRLDSLYFVLPVSASLFRLFGIV